MRKLLLGLVGASALAFGSAANATLVVSTSTEVSAITGPNSPDGGIHYTFSYTSTCGSTGAPPAGSVSCGPTYSPFEATVSFMNDVAGFYGLGIQSTATLVDDGTGALVIDNDTDVDFSDAYIALTDGTIIQHLTPNMGSNDVQEAYSLSGLNLGVGSYVIHVFGNRGIASSFDGNLNFSPGTPAVPEPATWAMMLLGFGAIGWQLRRRRTPTLAQAA